MVALDDSGFTAQAAFYNIRVNGSLYEEINGSYFFCFLFENANKFFADYFSLLLRFFDTG